MFLWPVLAPAVMPAALSLARVQPSVEKVERRLNLDGPVLADTNYQSENDLQAHAARCKPKHVCFSGLCAQLSTVRSAVQEFLYHGLSDCFCTTAFLTVS
jgi:hypothetical protein